MKCMITSVSKSGMDDNYIPHHYAFSYVDIPFTFVDVCWYSKNPIFRRDGFTRIYSSENVKLLSQSHGWLILPKGKRPCSYWYHHGRQRRRNWKLACRNQNDLIVGWWNYQYPWLRICRNSNLIIEWCGKQFHQYELYKTFGRRFLPFCCCRLSRRIASNKGACGYPHLGLFKHDVMLLCRIFTNITQSAVLLNTLLHHKPVHPDKLF